VDFELDLDVDLDLNGLAASAGMNRAGQKSQRQELVDLETVSVHVDAQVHVQEQEAGFVPKCTFCDRN